MKKTILATIVAVFSLTITTGTNAGDWGCKCILCLSNPGGATEFSECVPPIERLWHHLHWGGSFPSCDMGSNSGVSVEQGYERWEPCKGGYTMVIKEVNKGEATYNVRVCRKQTGLKKVAIAGDDRHGGSQFKMVPVFDEYNQKRRTEPFWIQVNASGQKGKKYYYSRSR